MKRLSGKYLPLKYFLSYILLTLVLFFILPVEYSGANFALLLVFMLAFFYIFVMGYTLGIGKDDSEDSGSNRYEHLAIQITKVSIVISFLLYLWSFVDRFSHYELAITVDSLINVGNTYRNALHVELPTVLSVQILTLLSPITKTCLILGMYYSKKLPTKYRALWIVTLIIYLLTIIFFLGTQKYLGDILIYAFSITLIKDIKLKRNTILKVIFISVFIVIPLLVYVQYSRLTAYGGNLELHSLVRVDYGHWLFDVFGDDVGKAILFLMLYPSMGYYGLSLSLQMPFEWTYGIGNSFALMSYASQYFGINNIIQSTYPLRTQVATGWPALMYWQTIFPWLASDLTYIGSLVFMGIIAFIYARAWREVLIFENPLSVLVFSNITILLLFVPANNQLMQTRESTIAWLSLLLLWLLFHNKLNKKAAGSQKLPETDRLYYKPVVTRYE